MKYINIFLPLIAIGVIIGSFSCQSSSTAIYEPPPQIPSETPQLTFETPKYDSGEEKSEKEDVKIKSKEKSTKTIQEIDREKLDKKFKKKNKKN